MLVIPSLIDIGASWKVLPPGVHDASLGEVELRYATTPHRRHQFEGFERGLAALKLAGCKNIFLDGSFVTDKPNPNDFDVCWGPVGVDSKKLDPVLLNFTRKREAQKRKYGGEFFPSTTEAAPGVTFFDYFQKDPDTDRAKGIIRVH